MLVSLVLFETEFLNIVSISFTSLVLNELIMVALEITTWYVPPVPSHTRARLVDSRTLALAPPQAHVYGHLRGGHPRYVRHQHGVPARILWYVSRPSATPSPRLTRLRFARPRIRGIHSVCMEGGGHRGDQHAASVHHQADTQSDRACGIEQVALRPLSFLYLFTRVTYARV